MNKDKSAHGSRVLPGDNKLSKRLFPISISSICINYIDIFSIFKFSASKGKRFESSSEI